MRLRRLPRGPTLLSSSFPSSLPPPAPPSAEDWSQSSHRAPCQGRTSPWKPWSKGLITLSLSILDDPLGLSDANPLEGNVYSVCPSTPMPHSPTPTSRAQKCSWTTCSHHPAGNGREFNGSLCQAAPRMSVWSSRDPDTVQRPKEMVGDPWSFDADVFNFLGLLTLLFT